MYGAKTLLYFVFVKSWRCVCATYIHSYNGDCLHFVSSAYFWKSFPPRFKHDRVDRTEGTKGWRNTVSHVSYLVNDLVRVSVPSIKIPVREKLFNSVCTEYVSYLVCYHGIPALVTSTRLYPIPVPYRIVSIWVNVSYRNRMHYRYQLYQYGNKDAVFQPWLCSDMHIRPTGKWPRQL